MFDLEFYPTPEAVIEKMLGGLEIAGKVFLEPSAGKGNIVDVIKKCGGEVIACERHPNLATIIASKTKFLKDDFFEVTADEISHIDYIVMNPPFSNADKHILHAWDIAPSGCQIIALCNYSTLTNAYSRNRSRLSNLVGDYGYSENLGDVFSSAERKTGIDIGLITLMKPIDNDSFNAFFDMDDVEEEQYEGIIKYNAIRDVVQRYVGACKLFENVAENAVQMHNLIGQFNVGKIVFSIKQDDREQSISEFKKELQKQCWHWVFNKMNMQKYLTESLKKEINLFVEKQQNVPFTMKNIYKMMELVVGTHGSRMDRAMVEIFDKLTMHYHENRYSVEGWKTNSHYLVNKKFILEYVAKHYYSNGAPNIRYGGNGDKMNDLQKALCYLTGQPYNDQKTLHQFFDATIYVDGVRHYDYKSWGVWYDWGFFTIKVFKKGTMHAKFKDDKVWELFNRAVARAKGYPLPDSVKI